MRLALRPLCLAGLAAALAVRLLAQDSALPPSSDDGIMLDPFPVVGTRLAPPGNTAPPDLIVLDEAFIQRSGATDLASLVNLLPQTYGGAASGAGTVPNGSPSYGNATALYNFTTGGNAALAQTGVASTGLGAFGASGTLVLIDGRRLPLATQEDTASATGSGFYDLASIPLGLVERVEVITNGASAIHGSDAVGGVVNIILRRHANHTELTTGIRGTFEGGAFSRHATLFTGVTRDRLSLFLSLTARSQSALRASQRAFSATQDFTALGGRDLRIQLGSPSVISAISGSLNGVTDADGLPARYAIIPQGQDGAELSPADFTGANGFSATRLSYYDASAQKDLLGASDQIGLHASARYEFSPQLEAFATVSWSDRQTHTLNEPPAIAGGGWGGAATIIPASNALNPFGQDVLFSGVLAEAPARPQEVAVSFTTLTAGLRGQWHTDWQWDATAHWAREQLDSRTTELNEAAFVAALADGRFNPFGDPATHGPINAHLNDELMQDARISGASEVFGFDAFARGPVLTLPGGDLLLAAGAEAQRAERDRHSTNPVFGQPAAIDSARTSTAAFAELFVPLFDSPNASPLLRRLNVRAAARYERAAAYAATSPSYGLQWQPVPDFTFFFDYAEGFRAPALTEIEDMSYSGTSTISDPLNDGARYAVTHLRGGNTDLEAETSQTYQFGLTYTPAFVSGFTLRAHLNETYWSNRINTLPEQTLVNHENRFSDRVTRDSSGVITLIDATTLNFGKIYSRALDLALTYRRPTTSLGTFLLQASAVRQLKYRIEDRPDQSGDTVLDGLDTVSPPQWSGLATLQWERGPWDATLMTRYLDGYASNSSGPFLDVLTAYPSWITVDLRIGYTFTDGLWRGYGKRARLQLGIGNLADRQPPLAQSPYGYNQSLHSPLGRTYDFSLRLPF